MAARKYLCIALICALLLGMSLSGCSEKQIQIYDKDGNLIAALSSVDPNSWELTDESLRAYLEIVVDEAVRTVGELEQLDTKQAQKQLLKEQYSIYTALDPQVLSALKLAYEAAGQSELSCGAAVTDLKGHLVAVYSTAGANYATAPQAPYSSFKPLSVYAPAIENGVANYSAVYEDRPVKTIENEAGELTDWPVNATNTYRYEPVSIAVAMRESLNTVAVRCLETVGVMESIDFLEERFGLTLTFEKNKAEALGADEVIGNVALGYLQEGVSPVQMAGYFQAFAALGKYAEPKTVTRLCDGDGSEVYTYTPQLQSVMRSGTAHIMNQLLQLVVTPGGTGEKAWCQEFAVAGKTGTGDAGNWFVGITPEYSCAIWHGNELQTNNAASMFKTAVTRFPTKGITSFNISPDVEQGIFCTESGLLMGPGCKKIDLGYYEKEKAPDICGIHG